MLLLQNGKDLNSLLSIFVSMIQATRNGNGYNGNGYGILGADIPPTLTSEQISYWTTGPLNLTQPEQETLGDLNRRLGMIEGDFETSARLIEQAISLALIHTRVTGRPALSRLLYAKLGRLYEREATFGQRNSLTQSRADLYLAAALGYNHADALVGGTTDFGFRQTEALNGARYVFGELGRQNLASQASARSDGVLEAYFGSDTQVAVWDERQVEGYVVDTAEQLATGNGRLSTGRLAKPVPYDLIISDLRGWEPALEEILSGAINPATMRPPKLIVLTATPSVNPIFPLLYGQTIAQEKRKGEN